MERGKCVTHLSLLHKRPCFFCGSQKGHKKSRDTFSSVSVKYPEGQLLFRRYRMSIQISHRPPVQKVSITSRISPPVLRFPLPLLMLSVLSHKSVMLSSSMLLLSFSAMLPPRLEAKAATMAAATPPITPMSFKRFLDFSESLSATAAASDREYKSSAQMSGCRCPAFFQENPSRGYTYRNNCAYSLDRLPSLPG